MADTRQCSRCGTDLVVQSLGGLCPKCMLGSAARRAAEAGPRAEHGGQETGGREPEAEGSSSLRPRPAPPGKGVVFGDYELLEEIARGGMGVIYKARQRSLNRLVALKMILAGQLASKEQVERFRAEAQAAAHLQHPNIVTIHEVGEAEGQHYFSMDYVEGRTLSELLHEGPMVARQAAIYLRTMAEAVHHAHQHGIIHRDLKPSNVLIDANDQPRITDFGLAKRLEPKSPAGAPHSAFRIPHSAFELTLSGQVLGSPNYLPPEQAGGKRAEVGPPSDVYALGAILYHLLTGRPPFQAESLTTLIRQVLETEPVAPRLLNPSIPRDLETICLKCLEKEMPRRYGSARELAEELGRFLEDQPIQARPVRAPEKVWRWGRRNPRLATAMGVAVLSVLVGFAGITWQWRRAERQRHRAEASEQLVRQRAYVSDMNLAFQALANHDFNRVQELLDRHRPRDQSEVDLRHWEWRFLWRQCREQFSFRLCERPRTITKLAFKADGELAIGEWFGRVTFWDLPTRQKRFESRQDSAFRAVAVCPARNLVAQGVRMPRGQPDEIAVWDAATDKTIPQRAILTGPTPQCLAFSPDGRLLACKVTYSEGSLDKGRRKVMQIWDVDSGKLKVESPLSPDLTVYPGFAVEFRPQGDLLAVGEADGTIRLIEVASGREKTNFTARSGLVYSLAFSPDGHLLAAGSWMNPIVRLWDIETGQRTDLPGHAAGISSLGFDSSGQILASGSLDQTIRLWDVAGHRCLARFMGHQEIVTSLVFSPDGRYLVSGEWAQGTRDAAVYGWSVSRYVREVSRLPAQAEESYQTLPCRTLSVAFSRDSKTFLAASGAVVRFDTATLKPIEELRGLGTNNSVVALSPDGRWLAAGQSNGAVRVWEADRLRELTNFSVANARSQVDVLRFLGQGRLVLTLSMMTYYMGVLWDTATWQPREPWSARSGVPVDEEIFSAEGSPDGSVLATGHVDGSIQLWNLRTGERQARLVGHKFRVDWLAFSPDGRWLASTAFDGSVQLWDVGDRPRPRPLRGHTNPIYKLAFSPDGRRLAGVPVTAKEEVLLWDVATQQLVATLSREGSSGFFTAFAPDGNTLVVVDRDGLARFWHAPSLAEIEAAEQANLRESLGAPPSMAR